MNELWFDELAEFIKIPSISADPEHAKDVRAAAHWVDDFLTQAGAFSAVLDWKGQPLVVAEMPASHDAKSAPTVLLYGHFDVQGEGPLDLWDSDPYTLEIRGEWAYARGVVDDKGSLYMLLRAAADLAAVRGLPVNVRFVCDGEEETLGTSVVEYLEVDDQPADACVIYDSAMVRRDVPSFCIGTRGNVMGHVTVRSGERDLHSGAYGGAALNAVHVLNAVLANVCAKDGRLPQAIRAGLTPPTRAELSDYNLLENGADVLAAVGARPADTRAAAEYHSRVRLEPTVEVTGIIGGSPDVEKTIVPAYAEARVSARLGAGQDPVLISRTIERLLKAAAPAGAEIEFKCSSSTRASLFPADSPAIHLASDAFESVCGRRPLLLRAGGTLPIMPALQARGVPTVLTGFGLPDSHVHSPNERMLVDYIPTGIAAAQEVIRRFSALPQ